MTNIKVRFAPSPTGYMHIGNTRTAVFNWLLAKKLGGEFMLRIDDTDVARSKKEYEDALRDILQWLGLTWSSEARQSARMARYDEVVAALKAEGRVYACYETAEELEIMRKRLMNKGLPPIYDRGALKLTAEDIARYEAEGRKPHYRKKKTRASSSGTIWCAAIAAMRRAIWLTRLSSGKTEAISIIFRRLLMTLILA